MDYLIKKIDNKSYEYNIINCDTCRIYQDGVGIGKYNFLKNKFEPVFEDWASIDQFKQRTKRQQKLILKYANIYFMRLYKKIYYSKLKAGEFFAPTKETTQNESYYIKKIIKLNENIEGLGV